MDDILPSVAIVTSLFISIPSSKMLDSDLEMSLYGQLQELQEFLKMLMLLRVIMVLSKFSRILLSTNHSRQTSKMREYLVGVSLV